MTIETKRLALISCDSKLLQAAIEGNTNLAQLLKVNVPDNWTEFGTHALQYSLNKLLESKDESEWWTYFPIYKPENKLIGSGGFKGKPTANGTVELGYEIAPAYRNRGLATEMTKLLIEKAYQDKRVTNIIAHTLGEENASTKVLTKCGFRKVEEINDPEEGVIWQWRLNKMD